MLFMHELIAHNKGKTEKPSTEFVSIISNTVQEMDAYAMKLQKEEHFKVDTVCQPEEIAKGLTVVVVSLSK